MWRIWILAALLSALTALPLQGGEPASELASASDKRDIDPPADALSTLRIAPDIEHEARPAARQGQDEGGITLVIVGDTGLNSGRLIGC